jgi:hypothetical protein
LKPTKADAIDDLFNGLRLFHFLMLQTVV